MGRERSSLESLDKECGAQAEEPHPGEEKVKLASLKECLTILI